MYRHSDNPSSTFTSDFFLSVTTWYLFHMFTSFTIHTTNYCWIVCRTLNIKNSFHSRQMTSSNDVLFFLRIALLIFPNFPKCTHIRSNNNNNNNNSNKFIEFASLRDHATRTAILPTTSIRVRFRCFIFIVRILCDSIISCFAGCFCCFSCCCCCRCRCCCSFCCF